MSTPVLNIWMTIMLIVKCGDKLGSKSLNGPFFECNGKTWRPSLNFCSQHVESYITQKSFISLPLRCTYSLCSSHHLGKPPNNQISRKLPKVFSKFYCIWIKQNDFLAYFFLAITNLGVFKKKKQTWVVPYFGDFIVNSNMLDLDAIHSQLCMWSSNHP